MNITILQENLLPKLQEASRFIASKPQLPILSGVYLSCEEKHLVIRSTDLKVGFQTSIGGKVEEEGGCVVPIKFFVELLASLRPGPVTLTLKEKTLTISQNKTRSTLTTYPVIDFPPFPQIGEQTAVFNKKEFSEAIETIYYSASLDETRPILASVLLQLEEEECTLAATDGYRLAVSVIKTTQNEKQQKILIQSKMLSEIARIIGKGNDTEVRLYISTELAQASFQTDDTTMMVRLTEGNFPNYKAIIPASFSVLTVVDRESLIQALKTALVIAKESSSIVSMEIEKKILRVRGSSQSVGENEVELESSYSGEEKRNIACNAKFLLDFLTRVQTDHVNISLNEELKPIRIQPDEKSEITYIVMPFKK